MTTSDGPGVEATKASLQDALAALDGEACTLVSLEGANAVLMGGGDAQAGLVVTMQSPTRTAVLTCDGDTTGQHITLVAGGQPGDYPREHVVDLATATQTMQVRGVPNRGRAIASRAARIASSGSDFAPLRRPARFGRSSSMTSSDSSSR